MSGATFFRDEGGTPSPFWRGLSIVSIFLVFWPPIGGSVVWWIEFDGAAWLAATIVYAYMLCMPAALLVGLVHAVAAIRFHHNSIWVPLLAAVGAVYVTMVLTFVATVEMSPKPAIDLVDLINVPLESHAILLIASLIGSLICWRLTRPLARAA